MCKPSVRSVASRCLYRSLRKHTHPPRSCSGCNSDLERGVICLSAVVLCLQATHCLKNNLYCLLMFWQRAATNVYYLNVLTFVRNKQEAIMALFEWICSLTKKVSAWNKTQHIIMQGLVFVCVCVVPVHDVCVEKDIKGGMTVKKKWSKWLFLPQQPLLPTC